jgi:hypothetical protein
VPRYIATETIERKYFVPHDVGRGGIGCASSSWVAM